MNDLYKEAVAFTEKAQLSANKQEAETHWRSAISLVKQCLGSDPTNPQYNYFLGYIYYAKGSQENCIYTEVESYLRACLEKKPNDQFALCILGFHFFDRKLFKQSLDILSVVDENYFLTVDQAWRRLKIIELRICCHLYLHPREVQIDEIGSFINECLSSSDRMMVATPLEISVCLDSIIREGERVKNADKMFRMIYGLLKTLGRERDVAKHVDRVRLRNEATNAGGMPAQGT